MTWKKILFLVVLVTVSVAFFEFAFLFDFESGKMSEAGFAHKFGIWLFILLQVFFYLPCFVLGYGKTNVLWGFIPPAFLTVIFWILLTRHLNVTTEFSSSSFPFFYHCIAGSSFLSGFFGILVVYLVKRIITRHSKPDKEDLDKDLDKDLDNEDGNAELEIEIDKDAPNGMETNRKDQNSEVSPDNKVSGVNNDGN
ncbi:MAG: hypothetical protein K8T10_19420 [Candidatus Eremiobacteraeota bacterium]|nr:hypothetical protein [Candidatus Eremiobacteraeota bacterium]